MAIVADSRRPFLASTSQLTCRCTASPPNALHGLLTVCTGRSPCKATETDVHVGFDTGARMLKGVSLNQHLRVGDI